MGAATDLSGRLIKFEFAYSTSPSFIEMEIVSGRVRDTVASQSSYLPVGRQITNNLTHGRNVECNIQAVLLMANVPWDLISSSPQSNGSGSVITKRLGVGQSPESIFIRVNRGGTDDGDDYIDEQSHRFENPIITSLEHTFSTDTHQVYDLSFVADGEYYEPNKTN